MAEEEKKMEEKKEEAKQPAEEKKRDEKTPPAPAPTPTPEIVLKVYMHCEGCARKVRRSLKGFQGVEDVMTDWKTQKVVVRGEKADPVKVLERVQKKSHRKVELISPIPKPPSTAEDEKKPQEKEKEKMTLPEEKKKEEEPKTIITVVLKVHMHCEACAQEIQRRILRMKGVESARSDLKNSQVSVKGAFEPAKLVEFVYKRTGKKAVIVKQEAEKKEELAEEAKEEKKSEEEEESEKEKKEKKTEEEEARAEKEEEEEEEVKEEMKVMEMKRKEYQYYPSMYAMEMYAYPPPQMFSDENPNACSIM